MPESMSVERVALLRELGDDVRLTPGILMADAVALAERIVRETPGAVMLEQFNNPANPEAHRRTTAVELWEQTRGVVDAFVAGVGTGGTIASVGGVLKGRNPGVRIVAVEPAGAAVLSGGRLVTTDSGCDQVAGTEDGGLWPRRAGQKVTTDWDCDLVAVTVGVG